MAPTLRGEQSQGKAGVSEVLKAGEEGACPLPALPLGAQAGNASQKKTP